jgi:exodeoxyribonuclease III
METVSRTLAGDEKDSHSRYLEVTIGGLRVVNIYLPNGNPVGSNNFAYKLAWMDRLHRQLKIWGKKGSSDPDRWGLQCHPRRYRLP